MVNNKEDSLEVVIRKMIHKELEIVEREKVDQLVKELIPELDKLICIKVKEHLKGIAEFILEKTK